MSAPAMGEEKINYRYLNLDAMQYVDSQSELVRQIGKGGVIKYFMHSPEGVFVVASRSDFTETQANLAAKKLREQEAMGEELPPYRWYRVEGSQHDTGRVDNAGGGYFATTSSPQDAKLIADALNARACMALRQPGAENGKPVSVLTPSGWDFVDDIDPDWLQSLPVGTILYYPNATVATASLTGLPDLCNVALAFKEVVSKNTHRKPRIVGNEVEYRKEIDTFQIGRAVIDIAYGKALPTPTAPVNQPAAQEPVARLHIRDDDDGLSASVEVLNGEFLQPEHSPVNVYLAPAPLSAPAGSEQPQ